MARDALKEATGGVQPSTYLDYRLYLDAIYQRAKIAADDDYSYQRYADDLGFGPTTVMHQIVRGYRPLTTKAAVRVIRALALTGAERRYFMALVDYCNAKRADVREVLFQKLLELKERILPDELDQQVLEYFSEWYHPVIRELVGTPGFQAEPGWIATRIVPHIRPEQARASMQLLESLGLIAYDSKTSTYVQTHTRVSTGHRVKGMALTRYHQVMIEHGKEALTRVPAKRRDISAVTVNVDEATAQHLKAMVHAFQLQLLDVAEKAGGGAEVYQINIQLFPFTE